MQTMDVPKVAGFQEDPMITRHSHMFGEIRVYAPDSSPDRWAQDGWLLETQHGDKGHESPGLRHVIRADAIDFCLNHIAIVGPAQLWEDPEFSESLDEALA